MGSLLFNTAEDSIKNLYVDFVLTALGSLYAVGTSLHAVGTSHTTGTR